MDVVLQRMGPINNSPTVMEASFTNGAVVVPGQQMTFGRIRLVINPIPFSGDYTVYHPYGKGVFPGLVAGDRLFFTDDIGLGSGFALSSVTITPPADGAV